MSKKDLDQTFRSTVLDEDDAKLTGEIYKELKSYCERMDVILPDCEDKKQAYKLIQMAAILLSSCLMFSEKYDTYPVVEGIVRGDLRNQLKDENNGN